MLRNQELLESYRRGDKETFLLLYKKYSIPLKRFLQGGFSFSSQGKICRYKGADGQIDTEGIVQETFARAFVKTTRVNYDGVRPFQTYLFSIAKNLVLRECYFRERVINSDYVEDQNDNMSVFARFKDFGADENPEKRLLNKELYEILNNFTNILTKEEKLFFSWRFAKGFTQEATALKMGTTRARIKLLEKNVRKLFLDKLRDKGFLLDYAPNPRWRRENKMAVI